MPNPLASAQLKIRRQKIQGLLLMGLGLPGIFYLMEQIERNAAAHTFTGNQTIVLLAVYFGSVNFFALGLILLLAGLKNLPLLTETRLRKGLWVKLAGVNFLALCAALAMLACSTIAGYSATSGKSHGWLSPR
jgi:hypothetical protein